MPTLNSNSAQETKKIAHTIAQSHRAGGIIALKGELGAGKTTFAQGFAQSLGILDRIISPTFVLIRQHPIPKTKQILFHIDLYRLEGKIDIKELGIQELIDNEKNIVLIEWAEKITDQLPPKTVWINFQNTGENLREISFD